MDLMKSLAGNCINRWRRRGWDLYAPFYNRAQPALIRAFSLFGELSYEEFEKKVVAAAELEAGQAVLDVACGTGASHEHIIESIGRRGRLVAVDFSSQMLERARERGEKLQLRNISYRRANAEALSSSFEEESFDAVLSCNGLPNFPRPEAALSEMSCVLRPGGRIALSTINRDKCETHPLWRWAIKFPVSHFFYREELRETLRALGFSRVKFCEHGMMLIVTATKRRSRKKKAAEDSASAAGARRRRAKRTARRRSSVR